MSNRFRNELMRKMYDSCTDSARREIWILPNGSQKRGSSHSAAFWDGYNNRPTVFQSCDPAFKTTLSYAAYRAGQDWKRKTEGEMKKELVSTAKSVADRLTKSVPRKPWETFKRFRGCEKFYGCVDKAGFWFDSSADFATATHWVAMYYGHHELTKKEESEFMKESQCSIIHSDTLQRMYEAGLIK